LPGNVSFDSLPRIPIRRRELTCARVWSRNRRKRKSPGRVAAAGLAGLSTPNGPPPRCAGRPRGCLHLRFLLVGRVSWRPRPHPRTGQKRTANKQKAGCKQELSSVRRPLAERMAARRGPSAFFSSPWAITWNGRRWSRKSNFAQQMICYTRLASSSRRRGITSPDRSAPRRSGGWGLANLESACIPSRGIMKKRTSRHTGVISGQSPPVLDEHLERVPGGISRHAPSTRSPPPRNWGAYAQRLKPKAILFQEFRPFLTAGLDVRTRKMYRPPATADKTTLEGIRNK